MHIKRYNMRNWIYGLFLLASLPMVVGMAAAAMLAGLSYKKFGSAKLDEIREE